MNYSKKIEITLFEAASSLADPDELRAFLDLTCLGDPALRDRLEKLLTLQGRADDFFNLPPVKMPADVIRVSVLEGEDGGDAHGQSPELVASGAFIGRFRLLHRIGEGGCGVVYRAEQLDPVRREVALKIVKLGMDTEAVIARFELERQALAMMDHPNIARVLDVGTTTFGRPFFVMELVKGERIMDFCNIGQVDLRKRLQLFLPICSAIQHAHQKGVIHRDIKPSNVLVRQLDGEPVPTVIDFGIAKATMDDSIDHHTITISGQFLGTPAYMSPEQAKGGGDVDTRSDIYSLGVLLYELISGRPPFDPQHLKEAGPEEARRIICEQDPRPPSVVSGIRHIFELDWIVMKAMAKERQFRYDTANDLAADIRRFLANEPIVAGPPKRGYRLGKLIRRNKITFIAGAVSLLALLTGFGVSTRLYFLEKKATEEQGRLRNLAEISRNNESKLREAGQYQSIVSQATVLIRYGDLEGADKLLSAVPISETPFTLEASNDYRNVADWHFQSGRWEVAVKRYSSLVGSISKVDEPDNDVASLQLLYASPPTCISGDKAAYEKIRTFAIDRFGNTRHPVVALHILKVCLLLPADQELLSHLRPLAKVVVEGIENKESIMSHNQQLLDWGCISLALMHYREGNDETASMWANRCLSYGSRHNEREASARIILSLIEARAGKKQNATDLIGSVAELVSQGYGTERKSVYDNQGPWFNWVWAKILLREAQSLVGN